MQLSLNERGMQSPYCCEGKCTIAQYLFYECTTQVQVGIPESNDCSLCLSLTNMGYPQAMRLLGQLLQMSAMPPGLWPTAFPVGEPLEGLLPQAGG